MEYNPLVSIIIPTYNEKEDVRLSLDAAINMEYPFKEIIVVDDSTDNTPEIVKEYEKQGVKLIRREKRSNGCCGARNLGIQKANGEIVILLNADVFPPKDFIQKILPHYKNGADYLLVWQSVANQEYVFPRFVESDGNYSYEGKKWIEWTEGFSCRREAAIDIGLIPGDFPIPFCRDWLLGEKLEEKYKKVIDSSIVVQHIAPYTLKDYWRVRKNRGKFAFLFNYYIGTISMKKLWEHNESVEKATKKYSLNMIVLRTILKTVFNISRILLVFPVLLRSIKISKYSYKKKKDVIPFFWADVIQNIAFATGEWSAYLAVRRYNNGRGVK